MAGFGGRPLGVVGASRGIVHDTVYTGRVKACDARGACPSA